MEIDGAGSRAADTSFDTIDGVVGSIDRVGQLAYPTVALDDGRSLRLETYADKIAGRGVEPGGKVTLRWRPARATVVLDQQPSA